MTEAVPLWNWAPVARLALLGLAIAAAPLAWVWLRHRNGDPLARLRALTLVTLFLTFDLILSGLGCPDWPGCYGSASPIGATRQIDAAQTAMPDGPVTTSKAWIEMIHRYLATGVGVLIVVMTASAWALHRRARPVLPVSPWWPTATLVWVCLQGAFGALTVTLKLYPAIVTLHLLGGIALLTLLALQAEGWRDGPALSLSTSVRRGVVALLILTVMQVALGGWVSTNYAVLACTDFPTCHGRWWPDMDFAEGFAVLRPLGRGPDGGVLEMDALTAIHYTHRLMAYAVLLALMALAWSLYRAPHRASPRWALFLTIVAVWQLATGVSNVVLGWPLLAAVSHTGGAAVLVAGLATLWMRSRSVKSGS